MIFALVPAIASASLRVAVAMPDMRQRKLSAVRSAASTPRALPVMWATTSPRAIPAPSARRRSMRNPGSASSKASSAASSPASTLGWRATISASATAPRGTIASVVMSPARPRSSISAARTIGSMSRRSTVRRSSAQRHHALDGAARRLGDGRVDGDLVRHSFERAPDLRQRDALHVRAEIARPHEFELGILQRDIVAHRAFGQKHDARRPLPADIVGHRRGRAGKVAFGDDLGRAFRMSEDGDAGMALAQAPDVLGGKALVHLAMTHPGNDLDLRLRRDVASQILIRQHDHARYAERLDDL